MGLSSMSNRMAILTLAILASCGYTVDAYSRSSLGQGPENNIFAPASSNPTLNTYTYNNNHQSNGDGISGMGMNGNGNGHGHGHGNGNGGGNGGDRDRERDKNSNNMNTAGAAGASSTGIIDPHYVFGAKHHMPIIPNMPIFPYNSPTSAPSFQQFPQPNHPGSVLNPGYPMHGLQPVNPYNPPFVFGQQPFYGGPTGGTGGSGVGGPPGSGGGVSGGGLGLPSSTLGILGGGGGGLAPYGSNYQGYQSQHSNANMYNKPPPQYQNQNQQNPYNRRTQAHPSAAGHLGSSRPVLVLLAMGLILGQLHT
nr:heterogeneous nuclear ribonucleoprotein 1 isoform X3 [Drosophila bipectinata]